MAAPEGRAAARMLTTPLPVPRGLAPRGPSAHGALMHCRVHRWIGERGLLMAEDKADRLGRESEPRLESHPRCHTCHLHGPGLLGFLSASLQFPVYGREVNLLPAP